MKDDSLSPLFHEVPHGSAHRARLNAAAINEPIAEATGKLIALLNECRDDALSLRTHDVPSRIKSKGLSTYLGSLRGRIADQCKLAPQNIVLLRDSENKSRYYFLAGTRCDVGKVVERHGAGSSVRAFEVTLQTLLLQSAGALGAEVAGAIGPDGFKAVPYVLVSTEEKKWGLLLNCLEVKLALNHHSQLYVHTVRRVFSVRPDEGAPRSVAIPLEVSGAVTRLALLDHKNARSEGARTKQARRAFPDASLDVDKVRLSRLYVLNLLLGAVQNLLQQSGVQFSTVDFAATHYTRGAYLKPENFPFPEKLTVVTACALERHTCEELERELRSLLSDRRTSQVAITWIDQEKLQLPLLDDRGYLFLNRTIPCIVESEEEAESPHAGIKEDEDEVSCTVRGRPEKPEHAFSLLARGLASVDDVDLYTRAKYLHVISTSRGTACLQGIDLHRDDGSDLLGSHKLRKAVQELSMKWALLRGHLAADVPMTGDGLRAMYTRVRSGMRGEIELETVACVEVRRNRGGLDLHTSRVPPHDHLGLLQAVERNALIGRAASSGAPDGSTLSGLRNAVFVLESLALHDSTCLLVYDGSTSAIPKIIGNLEQPLLHEQLDSLLTSLPEGRRGLSRSKVDNLMPYYLEGYRGQKGRTAEFVFIDARNPMFLRYFVPSLNPLDSNFTFSRLYDLMLYRRDDGGRQAPLPISLDHPLVAAYFAMMTQDVVRLGENSKNTLLRKLAGLALLN